MRQLTPTELAEQIAAFLVFKRALGYPYVGGEMTLRSFERFATRGCGPATRFDLSATIHAWLLRKPGRKPVTLANNLGVIRQFCLYQRRRDPAAFVPPVAMAPQTESRYVPYVFSVDEVGRLVKAAGQHRGRSFWPGMLRMLLLATYCTGLRLGEATRLRLDDLDQEHDVLHIRTSKGRSRDVPFQPDLAREFARYLRQRADRLRTVGREQERALFVALSGRGITVRGAWYVISRLIRHVGIQAQPGRPGPRPYDLRHNSDAGIIPTGDLSGGHFPGNLAAGDAHNSA